MPEELLTSGKQSLLHSLILYLIPDVLLFQGSTSLHWASGFRPDQKLGATHRWRETAHWHVGLQKAHALSRYVYKKKRAQIPP